MKIDVVIAGTQKGGTTALYEYLRQHPAMCLARRKEIHFFDREGNFAGGEPDYSQYHKLWDWSDPRKVRVEATPIYMYWQHAPERMWKYNPDLKIIMLLRDPIKRAYSHWQMERARGREAQDFAGAIRLEPARCSEALPLQHRIFSYVDRGFYCTQLQRIWRYFPRARTLLIRHENFLANPAAELSRVWEFLDVGQPESIQPLPGPPGSYDPLRDPAVFETLRQVYWDETRELEQLLGWDCSHWLQPD